MKRARDSQEKFDHYVPVLVFTILGLAMQTLKWQNSRVDCVAIAALVFLFVSGMLSLLRLERNPAYWVKVANTNAWAEKVENAVKSGHPVELIKVLAEEKKAAQKADEAENTLGMRLYQVQRWAFVLGVGCLLLFNILPRLCR